METGARKITNKVVKATVQGGQRMRVSRIIFIIIKALGMIKDEDIMRAVSEEKTYEEVILNLFEFADIKTQEDAIDYIAKRIGCQGIY